MEESQLLAAIRQIVKEETQPMKEELAQVTATIQPMKEELAQVSAAIKNLDAKIDKGYAETAEAVGKVVTVIGEQIREAEKTIRDELVKVTSSIKKLDAKINSVETITAQNTSDVQWMKRKA